MPEPTFQDAKAALRKLMDAAEEAVKARWPEAEGFSYSFEQSCTPGRPFVSVFFDSAQGELQNMVALRGYDESAYMTFTPQLIRPKFSEDEGEALHDLLLLGAICGFWEVDGIMSLSGNTEQHFGTRIDPFGRYKAQTVSPLQFMLALESGALEEKWAKRRDWIEAGWYAWQAQHRTMMFGIEQDNQHALVPRLANWDDTPDYLG